MADITIGCSHHIVISTPAGARTLDTLIKSQVLYQLSYKRVTFQFCGCKGTNFFPIHQTFLLFFLFVSIIFVIFHLSSPFLHSAHSSICDKECEKL